MTGFKTICIAGLLLSCFACTQISTPTNANRYFGGTATKTSTATAALGNAYEERVAQVNNEFFYGSFYAKVKSIDVATADDRRNLRVRKNAALYRVHLEGERGTEVSVLTSKNVVVGEEVLFVYSQDIGEVYRSDEPEYRHNMPKQRSPK